MQSRLKIGDVFELKLDESKKCFFQFIGFDVPQLNSEVIRVFKKRYSLNEVIEIENIVADNIQLYAHTYSVSKGEKEGLWKKIGHISEIGDPNTLLFNSWLGNKTEFPKFWHVWHMNGSLIQVKANDKKLPNSHIGGTFLNNKDIVDWIDSDTYPFFYPNYKNNN